MRRLALLIAVVAAVVGAGPGRSSVWQMSLNQIVSYIPKEDRPGKGGKWEAGAREAARKAMEKEVVGKLYRYQIAVAALDFKDGQCSVSSEHNGVGELDTVLEAPVVHMTEAQLKELGIKKNGRAQLTGKVSKIEIHETGLGRTPWFRVTVTLGEETVISKWRSG